MGGAGGHMNHPHDLDHVKNGHDFVRFFISDLPDILFGSIKYKKPTITVKLDGVNAAIKFHVEDVIINNNQDIDIKAAIQRGAISDITNPHYTPLTRFKDKGESGQHGMVAVYNDLLNIANKAAKATLLEIKSKGFDIEQSFRNIATRNVPAFEGEAEVYYDIIFDIEAIYPDVKNTIEYQEFRSTVKADKIFVLNGIKKVKLTKRKDTEILKSGKQSKRVVTDKEEEYLDLHNLLSQKDSPERILYENLVDVAKANNIVFKTRLQAEFLLSNINDDIKPSDITIDHIELMKRKKNALLNEVNRIFDSRLNFGDSDSNTIRHYILKLDNLLGPNSIEKLRDESSTQYNEVEILLNKNGIENKRKIKYLNKETLYSGVLLNNINMLDNQSELKFPSDMQIKDQIFNFDIIKGCSAIWEAERLLGNLYLKFFKGKLGPEQNFDIHTDSFKHEGVVIEVSSDNIDLPIQDLRFKLTGDFIVSGMMSQFKK